MATTFPMPIPHAPTGFVNQAALDTAFTTPIHDLAAIAPQGILGEATSGSAVTLSTTSSFAGLATVTFTLTATRRVRIMVQASFVPAGTSSVRWTIQPGYNTGVSASIGSVTLVGASYDVSKDGGGTTGRSQSASSTGTKLLPAGTYTAYAAIARPVGGSASDTVTNFYILVEDIGGS